MFSAHEYSKRRNRLMSDIASGLVLLMGNTLSPKESKDNCYIFHQDSSFLYFFGIDLPGLAAVLDVDEGTVTVFGDEVSLDDLIWAGPQPSLAHRCRRIGVDREQGQRSVFVDRKRGRVAGDKACGVFNLKTDRVSGIDR